MATQLPLAVHLPDDETFASFEVGQNSQLVTHLLSLLEQTPPFDGPPLTYISAEQGEGKSHLLYALCHAAAKDNIPHIYIDCQQREEFGVELLQGLEVIALICIDNIHTLHEDEAWQIAFFDLINRAKETSGCHLVVTANAGPASLKLSLPDLKSRLAWGITFQLQSMADDQRIRALMTRAELRGMNMSEEVARFMHNHLPRDMVSMLRCLDQLDKHSLQAQRRLTIPFVKAVLGL